MLKYWYAGTSSAVHSARIVFHELGLEVEEEQLDLESEHARAALSGLKTWIVPTLQIPDPPGFLHLIPDMAEYLGMLVPPQRRLVPDEEELGFQVRRWGQYVSQLVGEPIGHLYRGETSGSVLWLESSLATLEARLQDEDYLVDDRFSLADCALGVCLRAYQERVDLRPRYPALAAYLQRLMRRPSFSRG